VKLNSKVDRLTGGRVAPFRVAVPLLMPLITSAWSSSVLALCGCVVASVRCENVCVWWKVKKRQHNKKEMHRRRTRTTQEVKYDRPLVVFAKVTETVLRLTSSFQMKPVVIDRVSIRFPSK